MPENPKTFNGNSLDQVVTNHLFNIIYVSSLLLCLGLKTERIRAVSEDGRSCQTQQYAVTHIPACGTGNYLSPPQLKKCFSCAGECKPLPRAWVSSAGMKMHRHMVVALQRWLVAIIIRAEMCHSRFVSCSPLTLALGNIRLFCKARNVPVDWNSLRLSNQGFSLCRTTPVQFPVHCYHNHNKNKHFLYKRSR